MNRRNDGRETWNRLREWDKGQAPSERLAAQISIAEGFTAIDPSHPLGGRDGLKDILCERNNSRFIAACYFPRGEKTFKETKNKFIKDLDGIASNGTDGIIFITNQELALKERTELIELTGDDKILELYHLERLAMILNSPNNYGTRLEFLDIEMTKEEQIAFVTKKDDLIYTLLNYLQQANVQDDIKTKGLPISVTSEKIDLYSLAGLESLNPYHQCTHCRYGFKVEGRDGKSLRIKPISFSPFTSNDSGIVEYVTCPKCNNVDKL